MAETTVAGAQATITILVKEKFQFTGNYIRASVLENSRYNSFGITPEKAIGKLLKFAADALGASKVSDEVTSEQLAALVRSSGEFGDFRIKFIEKKTRNNARS